MLLIFYICTALFPAAQVTYTLDINRFPQNFEFLRYVSGDFYNIKGLMMEIYNPFALYALEMLMFFHAAVITPDIAGTFDNECGSNFIECQQGPVNRIQRNARIQLSYFCIQNLR